MVYITYRRVRVQFSLDPPQFDGHLLLVAEVVLGTTTIAAVAMVHPRLLTNLPEHTLSSNALGVAPHACLEPTVLLSYRLVCEMGHPLVCCLRSGRTIIVDAAAVNPGVSHVTAQHAQRRTSDS